MGVLESLRDEWGKTRQVKWPFLICLVAVGGVIWWAMDWRYGGKIDNLQAEVDHLKKIAMQPASLTPAADSSPTTESEGPQSSRPIPPMAVASAPAKPETTNPSAANLAAALPRHEKAPKQSVTANRGQAADTINNSGPVYNAPATTVSSQNQSGGITAGNLNVYNAKKQRRLEQQGMDFMTQHIPKTAKVSVTAVMGDSEALIYALEVTNWLKANGWTSVNGVNQAMYAGPVIGQGVVPKPDGSFDIQIGNQPTQQ